MQSKKHLTFFVFLVFAPFLLSAQQNEKSKWNFQIKTGGVLATHKFENLLVAVQPVYDPYMNIIYYTASFMLHRHKYRVGFDFGGYVEYIPAHAKYFSIISGLSYRQRGFVAGPLAFLGVSGQGTPDRSLANNRLDYISLDLGLKLKMTKVIYWVAGIRYDYLIYKDTHPSFSFYMDYFKGREYSPFFIQGFNFNIFKKYTTALEFEVNPGVQKLNFNESTFINIPPNSKNYLTNFAMSLNLVVGIKK